MARIVRWPIGLGKVSYQRLSGPRSIGASSTESVTGFIQTVSTVFGAWRYQLTVRPMNNRLLRMWRAMVTGLHGGANAVRVTFSDPDGLTWGDCGGNPSAYLTPGVTWSNGKPWSNGKNWAVGMPWAVVAADADLGDTTISLTSATFGHNLAGGEWIGFVPYHFGKYEITEVIDAGQYRIWPPLRKAIEAGSYVTLRPVMAMRLESEGAGTVSRGLVVAEGQTVTLVEVQDPDVRDYFAD